MEWVGWVIFLVMWAGLSGICVWVLPDPVKLGRKLALRRVKAEVDPWASWKEIAANVKSLHEAEHKSWQDDFDHLVQTSCVHSYPATGSRPTYYTCLKCKYEEPWDGPHEGCICHYETVTTLYSPYPEYNVLHRHGNCMWHGIDYPVNRRTDRSNKPFKSVKELYG